MFSENRIIGLTIDEINAQRLKAGASPIVTGTVNAGNPASSGLQQFGNRTSDVGKAANATGATVGQQPYNPITGRAVQGASALMSPAPAMPTVTAEGAKNLTNQ